MVSSNLLRSFVYFKQKSFKVSNQNDFKQLIIFNTSIIAFFLLKGLFETQQKPKNLMSRGLMVVSIFGQMSDNIFFKFFFTISNFSNFIKCSLNFLVFLFFKRPEI